MQVGEPIRIEKLIYGGEGLSRVQGEVIFTPFVLPGELVEVERAASRKGAARANLLKILEASAERVAPRCPYYGRCGGCHYQHISYSAQLRAKASILAEALHRAGHIDYDANHIEVLSAESYGYRNRVQLHVQGTRIGYRARNSNSLVAIAECPISSPKINEAIGALNRMAREKRWPRSLEIIEIFTDEKQVQWNVKAARPLAKHFFEWLAEEVPGTVLGPLEYVVDTDHFTVSGESFFQVNRFLLSSLRGAASQDAQGASAWDLYAGVGLFSLKLAREYSDVTAVEGGRAAAADLKRNARRAGSALKTIQRQTESFLLEASDSPAFVLADPPRAGLDKSVTARLLEVRPAKIVVISCDPATLGRDLAALLPRYRIERLIMVDLFPQTFHIETIAHLRLNEEA